MGNCIARRAALLVLTLFTAAAQAREEPLWEAGLGLFGLYLPDYRGSDQSRGYVLPFPYFVYRGELIKADRDGLRGLFFRSDRVDLNASIGASLPVHSDKNEARAGMPDLKASVELGPSLEVHLWSMPDERVKLDLRLPVRFAVTLESSPRYIGAQFFPHLNVDIHDPLGLVDWNVGVLVGPLYTDERRNRYFYAVDPAFATPSRPAYTPGSGYAGMEFIAGVSKRYPGYWVGGFLRYDTLRGAAFEDSPLVKSKGYFGGGIAISWILGESKERVPVNEYGQAPR